MFACYWYYLVVPNETKAFINQVFEWLSTPIGVTGISIASIGYLAYKIIPLLPFTKSYKEKVQEELAEEKRKNKAFREVLTDKVNELNNTKKEVIDFCGAFEEKINNLEGQLLKVCETSPNAKIKAIGDQYKENKEKIEKQIKEKYDLANNTISNKIDSVTNDYNSILKEIEKLKESVYGKREETTNI